MSLQTFKEMLVDSLVDSAISLMPIDNMEHRNRNVPVPGPAISRFSANVHLVHYEYEDRNCVVCISPKTCEGTNYICKGCPHKHH